MWAGRPGRRAGVRPSSPAGRAGEQPGRSRGPRGSGPAWERVSEEGRSANCGRGLVAELELDRELLAAAVDVEHDRVAGPLLRDRVAERRRRRDALAVDADDDVAAEAVGLAVDRHVGRAGLEPGFRGGAALLHARDDQPVVDRKLRYLREIGRDLVDADADERVLDVPVPED